MLWLSDYGWMNKDSYYYYWAMLALNPLAFENKKDAGDRFHRNGPFAEILTMKEPIRTLGFILPCNKIYCVISLAYFRLLFHNFCKR